MSSLATYPYSSQYSTVVRPSYHPIMMLGPMGPYNPSRRAYDNRTQNLWFYVCSVSFMCTFVVLMVYSSIEIRRQMHDLTSQNAANYSTAGKTNVTGTTNPPLFEWHQPDGTGRTGGGRTSGREGVANENMVPDRDHVLVDTPEERRRANRRYQFTDASPYDTKKTTLSAAGTGSDVKRSPSSSATYRLTTTPKRVAVSHSSSGITSIKQTTDSGNSNSASVATDHKRTMDEGFRRGSQSSAKLPTATHPPGKLHEVTKVTQALTSRARDVSGNKAGVGTIRALSARR
ncbi:uncharacterized protein [Dermacentor albipictus]|uniref:uncharacterized protein n=1 Tax=Dermacentor albipictus TaxID=60249 RepID=UPI0038FC7154